MTSMFDLYSFGNYGFHAILDPLFAGTPLGHALLRRKDLFDGGVVFALLPQMPNRMEISNMIRYRFTMDPGYQWAQQLLDGTSDNPTRELCKILSTCYPPGGGATALVIENNAENSRDSYQENLANELPFYQGRGETPPSENYNTAFLNDHVYHHLPPAAMPLENLCRAVDDLGHDINVSMLTTWQANPGATEFSLGDIDQMAEKCILMYGMAFDFASYFVWVRIDCIPEDFSVYQLRVF